MIEVKNLVKIYGKHSAVNNISFSAGAGEILGFLGPNGAGKSTTMKILASFIAPTSGEAFINGMNVTTESIKTREIIGYLPENSPSYREMRVSEFLEFNAEVRQIKNAKARISELVEKTFLSDVYEQTIETLSKGYRQRVCFAQALLHDPQVLILDEPTDGLDPNQKNLVRRLIKEIAVTKTIILSTHILEEMEAVCNRAIIIDKGVIVADDKTSNLLKLADNYNSVSIKFNQSLSADFDQSIKAAVNLSKIEWFNDSHDIVLYPADKKPILEPVWNFLKAKGLTPKSIEVVKPHFDKVFTAITKN